MVVIEKIYFLKLKLSIIENFLSDDKTLREADILDAMDQHLHTRKSTTDEPPYGMYT